ncbi:uncharacterized protein K444DRAFT_428729 [Hyaloscypha bicolor E]|uniref:Uncharacterized protein n=1 Tax=Hyaloscypha bicolor E TaxID=1095630 RepID=A0A2J6T8C8_9HELO|nr:uncharacterized protein K444DRAFT_428729 [Hyaloscypha bicolor E]PMD59272.1 hypothetical protein K444DRAFT_428729 [Hyaloscypha bicolor E]
MASVVPDTIGYLGWLPPEIRAQIWGHFSIQPGFRFSYKKAKDGLGILRTCHFLRDEVSANIYNKVVLTFHLSPRVCSDTGSWLYLTTSVGARWNIHPNKAEFDHFRVLPYKGLKAIKIEIEAPSQEDPGQVVLLWTKIQDLMELLSQAEEFPSIDIYLRETNASWATNGTAHKTVPIDPEHLDEDEYVPDIEVVLMPLCKLRNVRTASIHVPKGFVTGNHLLYHIGRQMETAESFGRVRNGDLDEALDELPGTTANFMRVERLGRWFSKGDKSQYVEDWARICRNNEAARFFNMPGNLANRYVHLLALNPLSSGMKMIRYQLHLPLNRRADPFDGPEPFELLSRWNGAEFGRYVQRVSNFRRLGIDPSKQPWTMIEDGPPATRDQWHAYWAEGLPPLGRSETLEELIRFTGFGSPKTSEFSKWCWAFWKEMKESEKESENETKGGKSDEEKPKLRTELMRM